MNAPNAPKRKGPGLGKLKSRWRKPVTLSQEKIFEIEPLEAGAAIPLVVRSMPAMHSGRGVRGRTARASL